MARQVIIADRDKCYIRPTENAIKHRTIATYFEYLDQYESDAAGFHTGLNTQSKARKQCAVLWL